MPVRKKQSNIYLFIILLIIIIGLIVAICVITYPNIKTSDSVQLQNSTQVEDSIKTDTLEYVLSEKNGKWLGERKLSIVEHTLIFKKNLKLVKDSSYTVTVRNSMRLYNEIAPIQNLENILDLGLVIQSVE